jgi:hypothetical protein
VQLQATDVLSGCRQTIAEPFFSTTCSPVASIVFLGLTRNIHSPLESEPRYEPSYPRRPGTWATVSVDVEALVSEPTVA